MILQVTHVDLDGIGSILLSEYFNLNCEYLIINYGEEYENNDPTQSICIAKDYDSIIVTDFSPDENFYKFLTENYKDKYLVFDHHPQTENYKDDPNVFFDIKSSGTKIYFDYLREGKRLPTILENFVNLVSTYDTFNSKSPLWEEALNLNRVLYKNLVYYKNGYEKYRPFIQNQLRKINSGKHSKFFYTDKELIDIHSIIEDEQKQLSEAISILQIREDNKGFQYGIFHAPSKISYICKEILDHTEDIDYIICLNTYKKLNGRIHIRIKDSSELIVPDFYEYFKGHDKAGGGEVSIKEAIKIWNNKFELTNHHGEKLISGHI